jgi:5-hydroxyisourate hydrolase-like protein (transthyretin family)
MKHLVRPTPALVLASVFIAAGNLFATTCISKKPFKIQQVCGLVVVHDDVVPDVQVELVDLITDLPDVIKTVRTDTEGKFSFSNLPAGEYAIRVRSAGFATASQNFEVGKQKTETRCQKPITVKLEPAGGCSSVSVTRKR